MTAAFSTANLLLYLYPGRLSLLPPEAQIAVKWGVMGTIWGGAALFLASGLAVVVVALRVPNAPAKRLSP